VHGGDVIKSGICESPSGLPCGEAGLVALDKVLDSGRVRECMSLKTHVPRREPVQRAAYIAC